MSSFLPSGFLKQTSGTSVYVQVFTLSFCPHGFFNLLQVRLREYEASVSIGVLHQTSISDVPSLWRNGIALRTSNGVSAVLVLDSRESKITAKFSSRSIGKPFADIGNLQTIVGEAIHSLLTDKYHVDYDIFIPCELCLADGEAEPHLFSLKKTVGRAREKQQHFLQCQTGFHMTPLTTFDKIHHPSDRDSQVSDSQIQRMMDELELCRALIACKVYISCAPNDKYRPDFKSAVRMKRLLHENGIRAWVPSFECDQDHQVNSFVLQNSNMVVCLISEEYWSENSNLTMKEAQIFCKTSPKPVVPVVISDRSPEYPFEWMNSTLGLLLAGQLFENFLTPVDYEKNHKAFVERVHNLVSMQGLASQRGQLGFDFMVSYCWSNSLDAADRGQVQSNSGNQFSDPRVFKKRLECCARANSDQNFKGWLDIEQLALSGGLFEGIRTGLNSSRCVIICISDEYSQSANCRMECRFALKALGKPVILAIVGGHSETWKCTEVGMLTQDFWDKPDDRANTPFCVDFRGVKDQQDFEHLFQNLLCILASSIIIFSSIFFRHLPVSCHLCLHVSN